MPGAVDNWACRVVMATSEVMIYHVNRQVDLLWKNVTLSLAQKEEEDNLDIYMPMVQSYVDSLSLYVYVKLSW